MTLISKVKLFRYSHVGAKEERQYSSYSFFTSALDWLSGQRQAPAALYPRKRTVGIHWIGAWVCLRAGMDKEPTIKSFASAGD
jgi:hypothetical protein